MTRTAPKQSKTPFPSAPLPWGWNFLPPGGTLTRERCQSVGIEKEREQAVALVAAYREQEAISEANEHRGHVELVRQTHTFLEKRCWRC